MAARFGVLASGSGGNASVLLDRHAGLLIDAGIGPRLISSRMGQLGVSWSQIHAVLLTHTHGDHSPACRLLRERTGATVIGRRPPGDGRQDRRFLPDARTYWVDARPQRPSASYFKQF